jgi:hypothetical protein
MRQQSICIQRRRYGSRRNDSYSLLIFLTMTLGCTTFLVFGGWTMTSPRLALLFKSHLIRFLAIATMLVLGMVPRGDSQCQFGNNNYGIFINHYCFSDSDCEPAWCEYDICSATGSCQGGSLHYCIGMSYCGLYPGCLHCG